MAQFTYAKIQSFESIGLLARQDVQH